MHGLFIDVCSKTVSVIELPNDEPRLFEAIKQCIGCKVLALGAVFPNNDVLYVNQLGALESELYFKHSLGKAPIPDAAIVLGSVANTGDACNVRSGLAATRASVCFMNRWDALEWAAEAKQRFDRERAA